MRAQVVNLRTAVIGRRRAGVARGPRSRPSGRPRTARAAGRRRVWFDGEWHDTPVYRRERLPRRRRRSSGPAIVEQLDTTTVIEPGDRARVDALGNLVITVRGWTPALEGE